MEQVAGRKVGCMREMGEREMVSGRMKGSVWKVEDGEQGEEWTAGGVEIEG